MTVACFDARALGLLLPLHLHLGPDGRLRSCGPTAFRLLGAASGAADFFSLFEIRRPSGLTSMGLLQQAAGQRLFLAARHLPQTQFRAIAVPLAGEGDMLVNLSFGIDIIEAVRRHALTSADFAPTELAMELLYVVEAKSAVTDELRGLTLRLQGAKSVAEEQAATDMLTGLRNRRAFELALSRMIDAAQPFGLMHLDLDFFKQVNDSLGHAAGDHVLREVARILTVETRRGDTLARIGGDEFMLLLPGAADPARLTDIAQRIIDRVSEPMIYEGEVCRIAASVGITMSGFYQTPEAAVLMQDSDLALYAAKHAGRGCARMHLPQGMGQGAGQAP
jgi:diguanylate cyclase (GGDEF)-like protein